MVDSTRRFVLCLTVCYFVLVFFSPFSIAIISLGEERANLSAFRTFVRFARVWFCLFPLPLGVWEGLRLVIVAFPGLSSHLFVLRNIKRLFSGHSIMISSVYKTSGCLVQDGNNANSSPGSFLCYFLSALSSYLPHRIQSLFI